MFGTKISKKGAQKLNEARNLEKRVRDYLQIYVGQLSLQESKKSIEVSELALAKNRQAKLGMAVATLFKDDLQDLLLTKRFRSFGIYSHHPRLHIFTDKLDHRCVRHEYPGMD